MTKITADQNPDGAHKRKRNVGHRSFQEYTDARKQNAAERIRLLRERIHQEGVDIPAMAAEIGFAPRYGRLFVDIMKMYADTREERPKLVELTEKHGFSDKTIRVWAQVIGVPLRRDRHMIMKQGLAGDKPRFRKIASMAGVNWRNVAQLAAKHKISGVGNRWDNQPDIKRKAIAEALEDPTRSNKSIADDHHASPGYVALIRRKEKNRVPEAAPAVDRELFLDAAQVLVARHMNLISDEQRDAIKMVAEQPGWISRMNGKHPWPWAIRCWPKGSMITRQSLDTVLTYYLQKGGIKSPEDLQARVAAGFVCLKMPNRIFKALHLALAAREVNFDRGKIQQTPGASGEWIPARSVMNRLVAQLCPQT